MIYFGSACTLAACAYLLEGDEFRLLITILSLAIIVVSWTRSPFLGIGATFIYLLPLGDVRRAADMVMGERGLDPLLLVGPIATILFTLPIFIQLKLKSRLSKLLLAFMALMIVEIFNPEQGSPIVGLGGALFYIIPVLWFWIGRKYATDAVMEKLFRWVVVPFGIAGALLGIYQTAFGFLPWEQYWIDAIGKGYMALYVGHGQVRSFGFLSSSQEYGNLLVITSVYILSQILLKKRTLVLLLPILGTAIVYASMRNAILRLAIAAIAMWAVATVNSRVILRRLITTMIVAAIAFAYASRGGDDIETTGPKAQATTAQSATAHVTNGFAHPLDQRYSTAGVHSQLFIAGIVSSFTNPVGLGIGATTLAAGKFGKGGGTTEIDISDAFVTMGIVGGLLFAYILFYCYALSYKLVRRNYNSFRLPLWGLLIALITQWLSGQYVVGPLLWLCLGYLCRSVEGLDEAKETLPAPNASQLAASVV